MKTQNLYVLRHNIPITFVFPQYAISLIYFHPLISKWKYGSCKKKNNRFRKYMKINFRFLDSNLFLSGFLRIRKIVMMLGNITLEITWRWNTSSWKISTFQDSHNPNLHACYSKLNDPYKYIRGFLGSQNIEKTSLQVLVPPFLLYTSISLFFFTESCWNRIN